MNQSAFILGGLLAAFVLFIAARGRLPLYASVLWGPAPSQGGTSSGGSGSGSPELGIPGLGHLFDQFGQSFPGGHAAGGSNPLGEIAGAAEFFSSFAAVL